MKYYDAREIKFMERRVSEERVFDKRFRSLGVFFIAEIAK